MSISGGRTHAMTTINLRITQKAGSVLINFSECALTHAVTSKYDYAYFSVVCCVADKLVDWKLH